MTYLDVAVWFLALAATVLATAVVLRRPSRRWWATTGLTLLAMGVLTVVFDSLMIAADLFRYGDGALVGVRLILAPVEDLAWPLAAVALLPSVWLLLGGRDR
ncbi:lycopene cyclase domain-containing protein [Nocardioides sp. cx-169]|uniref:lycopene cyclase domain-containing protein n=1 Tax=Nocardioides sp. cx-169 TaxID=2899080 RepID=UPI001E3C22D1|nr:lycopene cyclase domain-containing protein [Nocardioides sp. cx-169]MCD4536451.1 lycopene cyclase domain-containing protein [Nocardioides sp. cx-169]